MRKMDYKSNVYLRSDGSFIRIVERLVKERVYRRNKK